MEITIEKIKELNERNKTFIEGAIFALLAMEQKEPPPESQKRRGTGS